MILLGCALYAGPVTPEKALQVAQTVFASAPGTKAAGESELKIVWDGEFEPATKAAQDPAFYVISRPEGGFVMVAGNDNVQPVLAFSFENDFVVEGMPDNVRWWMEQYKDHVRSSVSATPAVREQWEKFESTKASPVSPVTNEFKDSRTNEWNQTNPANFYCPTVENQDETSVCGCVALATAEIMAWFGTSNPSLSSIWPDGKVIPGYIYTSNNSESVEVVEHNLTLTHDWTNLKALARPGRDDSKEDEFYEQVTGFNWANSDLYLYHGVGSNTLTTLGYDLAKLTYDIGTLIKAEYNDMDNNGTGAITANVTRAVAPVFGYNNEARYVSKSSYTSGQWEQLMKDQITQRPIIYTGPGHAYVADGYGTYDSKQYFHFNMGWGGDNNGYYTLDVQEKYENPHYAIIDFYPAPSTEAAAEQPLLSFQKGSATIAGLEYNSGTYTASLSFRLNGVGNVGSKNFSGKLYVKFVNPAGDPSTDPISLFNSNISIAMSLDKTTNLYGWSIDNLDVSSAKFGDQLVAYYREQGATTSFKPIVFDPIEVDFPALAIFPAAAIKRDASYKVGDYFVFELTNHDYTYKNSTWKVTAPDGTTTSYNMDDYRVKLTAAGDYKISCTTPEHETVVTYITVNAAP